MSLGGVFRLKRLLPPTRRERALAAKLADTRASLAAIAEVLLAFSALEDARAHLTIKAWREALVGLRGGRAFAPKPLSC